MSLSDKDAIRTLSGIDHTRQLISRLAAHEWMKPLADALTKLLEDPLLRQALDHAPQAEADAKPAARITH